MTLRGRFQTLLPFLFCILLLGAPAAGSKDTWIEVRSPNFTVISNAGEKEARKIADQFEQFRELFQKSFPTLRVDLGKPLIIFVVKDENSLKALLPSYWETKGQAHPAGIYLPGDDRHYVAVRTDLATENPYYVVYHEYTHAIMGLNYRGLPVWLNEGLAEYFGNSVIEEKDVEIGKVPAYHLQTLQQQQLIPIETLLQADERSPYYNEQNHASMFYAESWAIVHYLMLDPEARKKKLLNNFVSSWNASGDQVGAAQKTFGDLNKFEAAMELYARQRVFYMAKVQTTIRGEAKSYSSRVLPDAEVDAQRGLFYAHTRRTKEGLDAVNAAIKADPKLPLAYEAQGYLALSQGEFAVASYAFERAIELQTNDYFPYYFAAQARLRGGMPPEEEATKVAAYLEKAIQMNPQFAPAYAALASVYSMNQATKEKAFAPGRKAAELEPGNLLYATNYGYVLVNAGKTAEAKTLALRIQQAAKTPVDQANAQQLLDVVARREEYDSRVAAMNAQPAQAQNTTTVATNTGTTITMPISKGGESATEAPKERPKGKSVIEDHPRETEYAVEGYVSAADCSGGPGKISITVGKATMNFRFKDFAGVYVVSTAQQDSGEAPACAKWQGRRARVYFYKVVGKQLTGDVSAVQFF